MSLAYLKSHWIVVVAEVGNSSHLGRPAADPNGVGVDVGIGVGVVGLLVAMMSPGHSGDENAEDCWHSCNDVLCANDWAMLAVVGVVVVVR